jgi:hypothetical protein
MGVVVVMLAYVHLPVLIAATGGRGGWRAGPDGGVLRTLAGAGRRHDLAGLLQAARKIRPPRVALIT